MEDAYEKDKVDEFPRVVDTSAYEHSPPQPDLQPAVQPAVQPAFEPEIYMKNTDKAAEGALQFLFDLKPTERADVIREHLYKNNVDRKIDTDGVTTALVEPRRGLKWVPDEYSYIRGLRDLAAKKLGRPVEYMDYPALTDALHRHFRPKYRGKLYLERSYNSIHSKFHHKARK